MSFDAATGAIAGTPTVTSPTTTYTVTVTDAANGTGKRQLHAGGLRSAEGNAGRRLGVVDAESRGELHSGDGLGRHRPVDLQPHSRAAEWAELQRIDRCDHGYANRSWRIDQLHRYRACVLLAGVVSISGCGTANGFNGQAVKNYTVTVTAASAGVQHSFDLNLNVQ